MGNGNADYADNDAVTVSGGLAEITIQTGFSGNNNHNYDFGFAIIPLLAKDDLNLAAVKKTNSVLLKWSYKGDDSHGFVVERSANGINFNAIGTISDNTKALEFIDQNPVKGSNYYRIRVVKNGSVKYSNVQVVNFAGLREASIYPNPASTQLTVALKNVNSNQVTVRLYSQNGHLVLQKNYQTQNGSSAIQLDGLKQFSHGVYFIKISAGNDMMVQQKIILTH